MQGTWTQMKYNPTSMYIFLLRCLFKEGDTNLSCSQYFYRDWIKIHFSFIKLLQIYSAVGWCNNLLVNIIWITMWWYWWFLALWVTKWKMSNNKEELTLSAAAEVLFKVVPWLQWPYLLHFHFPKHSPLMKGSSSLSRFPDVFYSSHIFISLNRLPSPPLC